ncbi:Uncharacterized conserved protein [Collimonas sp. OK242]|uniref:hypothetical protein n=1 Tax=Collimonas sp. OK242 TaxID=1798195 RepID=UPI00089D6E36|nr:hypothetical protein [Collimonas sp. OK242]SDY45253.1 Uncharacterized conserved protein [Collimonas sp. OK242]
MWRFGKTFPIDREGWAWRLLTLGPLCLSLLATAASASPLAADTACRLTDSQAWPAYQYQGSCLKGLSDGRGVVRFINGDELQGQFKQGRLLEDKAEIRYINGDRYTGGIKDGLPEGDGVYVWRNGDVFKGSFRAGKKDGIGQYTEAQSGRHLQVRYHDDFLQELNQVPMAATATTAQQDQTTEAFRKTLKPGDQTNLGLVIEIKRKDGLVLVQTEETGLLGIPRFDYQRQRSGIDYTVGAQVAQRWVKLSQIYPPTLNARPEPGRGP